MQTILKASLILAGLVALLSIAVFLTGLHKSFMTGQVVFLAGAIAINVAAVYWALSRTAPASSYGGQVLNAAAIGAISAVLIVVVSWLLLSVVFPNAIEESRQGAVEYMQAGEFPPDEMQRQLDALEQTTALSQSIPGGFGAFFTSLITGAVLAFFKRKEKNEARSRQRSEGDLSTEVGSAEPLRLFQWWTLREKCRSELQELCWTNLLVATSQGFHSIDSSEIYSS